MAKAEITLVTLDHAQSFLNFVADTICKRACSSEALELPSRDSFVRVTRSTADAEDAFGKPIADVARLYTLVDVVVVSRKPEHAWLQSAHSNSVVHLCRREPAATFAESVCLGISDALQSLFPTADTETAGDAYVLTGSVCHKVYEKVPVVAVMRPATLNEHDLFPEALETLATELATLYTSRGYPVSVSCQHITDGRDSVALSMAFQDDAGAEAIIVIKGRATHDLTSFLSQEASSRFLSAIAKARSVIDFMGIDAFAETVFTLASQRSSLKQPRYALTGLAALVESIAATARLHMSTMKDDARTAAKLKTILLNRVTFDHKAQSRKRKPSYYVFPDCIPVYINTSRDSDYPEVFVVQCAKDSSSTPYSIRADALNQIIA